MTLFAVIYKIITHITSFRIINMIDINIDLFITGHQITPTQTEGLQLFPATCKNFERHVQHMVANKIADESYSCWIDGFVWIVVCSSRQTAGHWIGQDWISQCLDLSRIIFGQRRKQMLYNLSPEIDLSNNTANIGGCWNSILRHKWRSSRKICKHCRVYTSFFLLEAQKEK